MAILLGAESKGARQTRVRRAAGAGEARPRGTRARGVTLRGAESLRSSRHDRAAGRADTLAGRGLEAWARLTGGPAAGAKGKAARARGAGRKGKGRAKGGWRR